MTDVPFVIAEPQRRVILRALIETANCRKWLLCAAHVRENHVHLVLHCDCKPEHAMTSLKAYATRALRSTDLVRKRWWSRHGSTRYLWNPTSIAAAIEYTVHGQGLPMQVFLEENWQEQLNQKIDSEARP